MTYSFSSQTYQLKPSLGKNISRKLVWVQIDLIYLYNSLKSKVLNKMAQFFINRFSPKICHSFEVLLIGWEASL